jgi:hypothetical protein
MWRSGQSARPSPTRQVVSSNLTIAFAGRVAQLEECWSDVPVVAGSIPAPVIRARKAQVDERSRGKREGVGSIPIAGFSTLLDG